MANLKFDGLMRPARQDQDNFNFSEVLQYLGASKPEGDTGDV